MKHQQVYDGLGAMIAAGVHLTAALCTAVARGRGPLHNAMMAAAQSIEGGATLTAAMAKHPRVFPRFDLAVIDVAEKSGQLAEALHALAGWYGLRTRIWSIIKSGRCSGIQILRLHVDNSKTNGELNQLGDVFELQLFHDVGTVSFHRAGADTKNV